MCFQSSWNITLEEQLAFFFTHVLLVYQSDMSVRGSSTQGIQHLGQSQSVEISQQHKLTKQCSYFLKMLVIFSSMPFYTDHVYLPCCGSARTYSHMITYIGFGCCTLPSHIHPCLPFCRIHLGLSALSRLF